MNAIPALSFGSSSSFASKRTVSGGWLEWVIASMAEDGVAPSEIQRLLLEVFGVVADIDYVNEVAVDLR